MCPVRASDPLQVKMCPVRSSDTLQVKMCPVSQGFKHPASKDVMLVDGLMDMLTGLLTCWWVGLLTFWWIGLLRCCWLSLVTCLCSSWWTCGWLVWRADWWVGWQADNGLVDKLMMGCRRQGQQSYQVQLFQHNDPRQKLLNAIPRRNDTFYVLSFNTVSDSVCH